MRPWAKGKLSQHKCTTQLDLMSRMIMQMATGMREEACQHGLSWPRGLEKDA